MTTKKKTRKFRWSCGAYFEVRLVKSDRTRLQYRQVIRTGGPYTGWTNVDLGRAIAFAYGATIPTKGSFNEYWTPRGAMSLADLDTERVRSWRATTFQVLKYLGVVTR